MQLAKYRLALRRKEFETGNAGSERVVSELIVTEKGFVGMQIGHGTLLFSLLGGQRLVIGTQRLLENVAGEVSGHHGLAQVTEQHQP